LRARGKGKAVSSGPVDATPPLPPPHDTEMVAPAAPAPELPGAVSAERDACARASRVDVPYLGAMVLADAGTVVLDVEAFRSSGQPGVRMVGPALIGLSWGWSVGGAYMTLPQCTPGWRPGQAPEGDTRRVGPLTLSFSLLAAAMGPVIVGVETGQGSSTLAWAPGERVLRLVVAGGAGVVGSLLPYVLPPRPWRALRELEHLRAGADAHGAVVSYAIRF
jgi:hypothetical protein